MGSSFGRFSQNARYFTSGRVGQAQRAGTQHRLNTSAKYHRVDKVVNHYPRQGSKSAIVRSWVNLDLDWSLNEVLQIRPSSPIGESYSLHWSCVFSLY